MKPDEEDKPKLDLTDPQVQADIARAEKAAKLAHIIPPGKKGVTKARKPKEGYFPAKEMDRTNLDPRGPSSFSLTGPAAMEVLKLVSGRRLSLSRAQAVKRMVRRIRALMGAEAPNPRLLHWYCAEVIDLLSQDSGMVRLGILRQIAEMIGLLRPGLGLANTAPSRDRVVPRVTFRTVGNKPGAGSVEMTVKAEVQTVDFQKIPPKE